MLIKEYNHLMPEPAALLSRLNEIGLSLAGSGHALALIGLGSVGLETSRLDAYSDLDFFAIVEDGHKNGYIENLDWLANACPIAYQFRNTSDGYKLLFTDGIFCEFAVFELPELSQIPFAQGRVVWKQPWVAVTLGASAYTSPPMPAADPDWCVGEALTNLYVGLNRLRRGEKLSAARFIQQYAVDRVLELAPLIEVESNAPADPFDPERRFEQRFPHLAQEMPRFVQGYEHTPESALAILAFLEGHFLVNPLLAKEIRNLCT
jgi:lincosamide nucleotidyltransferase B/F